MVLPGRPFIAAAAASGSGPAAAAVATAGPTTRLPNGLAVRYVSKRDVAFLYQEIYQQRCYLRHGISLPRGGTVLDIGGNIGLFALSAAEELGPEGLVVSCEPLPPTYDCLQHNAAAHRSWWRQRRPTEAHGGAVAEAEAAGAAEAAAAEAGSMGLQPQFQNQQHHRQHQQQHQHQHQHQQGAPTDAGGPLGQAPARILPVNAGVGDGSAAAADFTFYPRAAGWSSMRPAGGEVLSDMGAFLDNALSSREASAAAGLDPAVAAAGRWLRAAAPGWLYTAVWRGAVRAMLGRSQQQRCRLVTVSGLIREHQLQAVDLLKVDVERAELEVLRGVEACHWPLVRQAALEVHETSLQEVLAVLRGPAGFSTVVVEQEAALAGSSLHSVYCHRR